MPLQGRFPRATHPCATRPGRNRISFDLHVLSMPPAFVLSQDQTLMFILTGAIPATETEPRIFWAAFTPSPVLKKPETDRPTRAGQQPIAAARASLPPSNNVNQQSGPLRRRAWRNRQRRLMPGSSEAGRHSLRSAAKAEDSDPSSPCPGAE